MKDGLSFEEKTTLVMNWIGVNPIHIDKIQELTGLTAYEVSSVLVSLELKGRARQSVGKLFSMVTPNMLMVGERIAVHGFVMLKGLDGGRQYLVHSDEPYYGKKTYTFRLILKSGKASLHDKCRHYAESVERSMNPLNYNRIEKLGK